MIFRFGVLLRRHEGLQLREEFVKTQGLVLHLTDLLRPELREREEHLATVLRTDRAVEIPLPFDRRDDLRDSRPRKPDKITQRSGRTGPTLLQAAEQHRLVDRNAMTLGKRLFKLVQRLVNLLDAANWFHLFDLFVTKIKLFSIKNYFYWKIIIGHAPLRKIEQALIGIHDNLTAHKEHAVRIIVIVTRLGSRGIHPINTPGIPVLGVWGFLLHDTVMTPWRVLIVAENLNQLVNTDLITNLNPAPNPDLFADTSWIRPGRSLWSWWSGINGRYMTLEGEREVIDLAASMGYEYSTLDEGWEELPDKWKTLRKLANHAAEKGVGLFVWRHWKRLNDPADNYAELQHFLDSVAGCGIRGVKIDFMNGEGLQQIRFTTAVLEQAAKRHLLVNFHGCQKPSGESRTYPNELTREGVRGLELNRITANYLKRMRAAGISVSDRKTLPGDENRNIPASHNATLPFTRCVTGPADYTPVAFSMPGDVLPAQQLACAYLIGSPLITLAENPFYLLKEKRLQPAVEFLRELPTCWDETVVLPQSRIGELALMARRSGATWYLAAAAAINFQGKIPLDFLGPGLWRATILEDDGKNGFLRSERTLEADTSIPLALQSNAGCVIRFVRQ